MSAQNYNTSEDNDKRLKEKAKELHVNGQNNANNEADNKCNEYTDFNNVITEMNSSSKEDVDAAVRHVMQQDYNDEDNIDVNNNEYYDENDVSVVEEDANIVGASRVSVLRNQFFAELDASSAVNPKRKMSMNHNSAEVQLQQEYFMGRPTIANATPLELSSSGMASSISLSTEPHDYTQTELTKSTEPILLHSHQREQQKEEEAEQSELQREVMSSAQTEHNSSKRQRRVSFKTDDIDTSVNSNNSSQNRNGHTSESHNVCVMENNQQPITRVNLWRRALNEIQRVHPFNTHAANVNHSNSNGSYVNNVNNDNNNNNNSNNNTSVNYHCNSNDASENFSGGVDSFVRSTRLERCSMLASNAAAGALMCTIVKRGIGSILMSLTVTQILVWTGYAHVRWRDLLADVCSFIGNPLRNQTLLEVAGAETNIHARSRWQQIAENVRTHQACKIAFCLGVLASLFSL